MRKCAEIIAVGTEILLGNIVNTNARDLSLTLSELGIDVYHHTTVGDNPGRLRAALELARSRSDIVITTGGLGPTCDDVTRTLACEVFGAELYFDKRAEAEIRQFYEELGFGEMPDNNLQQCWLPVGCVPFYNTCGTAPGCGYVRDGKALMILPGPPKELHAMMAHGGLDFLRSLGDEPLFSRNIHIFNMGESHVESLLRHEMETLTNPTLAPYAKEAEVRLRITAKAPDRESAEALMAPVMALVEQKLGAYIYGVDCESLERRVFELLKAQGKTFAAAESCTGGLIAKRITDLPGSSAVFRGGCTVYTNEAKTVLLDVPAALIEDKGVYSREVAAALAENVRRKLGADFGIGVTGVAGPDSDGVNAVGTVFVGLACESGTRVRSLHLGEHSDRSRIRTSAAHHAFDMLRRALCGLETE